MRAYNKIRYPIWGAGTTGRALRSCNDSVKLLAIWMFSNERSMAEPWGLYHCPVPVMAEGLNGSPAKVQAGLTCLADLGYAFHDAVSEWLWVVNMASEQVLQDGRPLKPTDNMAAAANRWYVRCPVNPFLAPFFDRYVAYLHLEQRRDAAGALPVTLNGVQPTLGGLDLGPLPASSSMSAVDLRVAEFNVWWAQYPAKGRSSKKTARETWMRLKPPAGEVMKGLERWQASQRWADGYIVDATRWLKEERYLEEPPAVRMPGLSERTRDVVEALDSGRSIFELDDAPAPQPAKRLRG